MKYYIKKDKMDVHSEYIRVPQDIKRWYCCDKFGRVLSTLQPRCRLIAAPNINDWRLVKREALRTMGADPDVEYMKVDKEWKHKILKAKHSPIRLLNYVLEFDNIPYCYAMHLVRHVHAVPFVASQRPDHQLSGEKYTELERLQMDQGALINFTLYVNAETLINIAEKRLCWKSSPFTRNMVTAACNCVLDDDGVWEGLLLPRCRKGDTCIEMQPCIYKEQLTKKGH